jgi:SAM-dependent methyltransferase
MDLKEENAIGGDPAGHWYYISKGRALKSLLGQSRVKGLLDVGAGSGVFSQMLVKEGRAERALCVDPNYEDEFVGRHSTDRISYVRSAEKVDADVVLMIDVIEHVDDDAQLIRDYADRVAPGTRFVISVPAFQMLWSSHDEFLEHRRRYTLSSLRSAVLAGGLQPLKLRYFFGLLFPAVAVARMTERKNGPATASRLKAAPQLLNATLVAIHDVERAMLFPLNQLAGVTAFCLAEKR